MIVSAAITYICFVLAIVVFGAALGVTRVTYEVWLASVLFALFALLAAAGVITGIAAALRPGQRLSAAIGILLNGVCLALVAWALTTNKVPV